jgi:hypothetical protein
MGKAQTRVFLAIRLEPELLAGSQELEAVPKENEI